MHINIVVFVSATLLCLPASFFLKSAPMDNNLGPSSMNKTIPTAEQIAKTLGLKEHVEGGFFRRTYQADHRDLLSTPSGERFLMTSIYYMLTKHSPIGHWHLNKSDIMHYFHFGDTIEYSLIYPNGSLEQVKLGANVLEGEKFQILVKGGVWKSSKLVTGEYGYGLISEAVSPGFNYSDMTLGKAKELKQMFPQHNSIIEAYSKQ